jgi:hypothetical protein
MSLESLWMHPRLLDGSPVLLQLGDGGCRRGRGLSSALWLVLGADDNHGCQDYPYSTLSCLVLARTRRAIGSKPDSA